MYDKDILQLFFEDPNKSVFPENQPQLYKLNKTAALTDIKYIQSVFFKDMFLLDILVIPKHQNAITTLRCVECQYSRSQNMFNFSVSFHQENA